MSWLTEAACWIPSQHPGALPEPKFHRLFGPRYQGQQRHRQCPSQPPQGQALLQHCVVFGHLGPGLWWNTVEISCAMDLPSHKNVVLNTRLCHLELKVSNQSRPGKAIVRMSYTSLANSLNDTSIRNTMDSPKSKWYNSMIPKSPNMLFLWTTLNPSNIEPSPELTSPWFRPGPNSPTNFSQPLAAYASTPMSDVAWGASLWGWRKQKARHIIRIQVVLQFSLSSISFCFNMYGTFRLSGSVQANVGRVIARKTRDTPLTFSWG